MELTVSGFMMTNFRSNSTGTTYDLIIFSNPDEISEGVASVIIKSRASSLKYTRVEIK